MTVAERIEAIVDAGHPIAFDGCHKLYFIENEEDRGEALSCGYEIFDAEELPKLYDVSCGLRFVHPWSLADNHPLDIRQGE